MARVTSPLLSMDASGSIGKTLTYQRWKQTKVCKLISDPGNPNSPDQEVIRGYFTTSVIAWHAESGGTKTAWQTYCTAHSLNMSGFNLYMRAYVEFLIGNAGTPPTTTNVPPTMS